LIEESDSIREDVAPDGMEHDEERCGFAFRYG
jgi:hypothetical protein